MSFKIIAVKDIAKDMNQYIDISISVGKLSATVEVLAIHRRARRAVIYMLVSCPGGMGQPDHGAVPGFGS